MTRDAAVVAVLGAMDSLGLKSPKLGKFAGDWRFLEDAGMDSLDEAELVLEIEDGFDVALPERVDATKTVGELADILFNAGKDSL